MSRILATCPPPGKQFRILSLASTAKTRVNLIPMNAPSLEEYPLTPLDYYNVVRSRIEHEDNLVVQRLSWLVASQSFLLHRLRHRDQRPGLATSATLLRPFLGPTRNSCIS